MFKEIKEYVQEKLRIEETVSETTDDWIDEVQIVSPISEEPSDNSDVGDDLDGDGIIDDDLDINDGNEDEDQLPEESINDASGDSDNQLPEEWTASNLITSIDAIQSPDMEIDLPTASLNNDSDSDNSESLKDGTVDKIYNVRRRTVRKKMQRKRRRRMQWRPGRIRCMLKDENAQFDGGDLTKNW